MVGFGLNAFLAAFLFRRFGYSVAEAGIIAGVIASFPATFSVVGAGWLADRLAKRDARSYGFIPAISLVITTPLYMLAVTRETPAAALVILGLATIFQYTYLAPSQGVFQNMMHPRMRASSAAVTSMIYSLVGAGVGPLLVGSLSDLFTPADAGLQGSAAGLSTAMAVTAIIYLWAAWHFYWATRTIRHELSLPL